jgi:hypothetical protein
MKEILTPKAQSLKASTSYTRIGFFIFVSFLSLIYFYGCEQPSQGTIAGDSGEWLIPSGEIHDGGPGKDGIPALSNPEFISASGGSYLRNNDLVLGVKVGRETRAYPHPILDWHEIINDEFGAKQFSVTYCPLTGSGIIWDRSSVGGNSTTFGVSGLLYNTNLIPYDRATNSNWSQMKLLCVSGNLAGERIKTYPAIETTWATWKKMAPNTEVVSASTGFSRSYGSYPYGDYRTNHNSLIFPISNNDGRLPRKNRVLGLIKDDETTAYPLKSFSTTGSVVHDDFAGIPIVIAGSSALNYAVAFDRRLGEKTLQFEAVSEQLPVLMTDNQGNQWDVFGEATSGPNKGEFLTPIEGYVAYWFAWATFWPATDLASF